MKTTRSARRLLGSYVKKLMGLGDISAKMHVVDILLFVSREDLPCAVQLSLRRNRKTDFPGLASGVEGLPTPLNVAPCFEYLISFLLADPNHNTRYPIQGPTFMCRGRV